MNPLQFIKAMKELKKNKGMTLCIKCMERITGKITDDDNAIDKSLEQYDKVNEPCFICGLDGDNYKLDLKKSMEAIKKVSKR